MYRLNSCGGFIPPNYPPIYPKEHGFGLGKKDIKDGNKGLNGTTNHGGHSDISVKDECILNIHCSGACNVVGNASTVEVGCGENRQCDPITQEYGVLGGEIFQTQNNGEGCMGTGF